MYINCPACNENRTFYETSLFCPNCGSKLEMWLYREAEAKEKKKEQEAQALWEKK